jgi:hypothetical protein
MTHIADPVAAANSGVDLFLVQDLCHTLGDLPRGERLAAADVEDSARAIRRLKHQAACLRHFVNRYEITFLFAVLENHRWIVV